MILVLDDGIRGHVHQSLGLARALGFPYEVVSIRWKKKTVARVLQTKRLSKSVNVEGDYYLSWLERNVEFSPIQQVLSGGNRMWLVISAGSKGAPVNLALSKLLSAKSVVCMLPEHINPMLFDLLILPEHDMKPGLSGNVVVTKGALNMVKEGPPLKERENIISVLVGGNDANYRLTIDWAEEFSSNVVELADRLGAALWVTTSRRTPVDVAEYLSRRILSYRPIVEVVLAHRTDKNPVPDMLGSSKVVVVTEDSVAMISEAASSGAIVLVARVGHRSGPKRWVDAILGKGIKKFDRFLESLRDEGYVHLLDRGSWSRYAFDVVVSTDRVKVLREAERVANIILQRWGKCEDIAGVTGA
ncbi:MAG: mitochondrial fission ELM1 family protein [Synergistetes bacterium]|nr:mitochondrial fission ELM1 family protein [Synergistota bacterium]